MKRIILLILIVNAMIFLCSSCNKNENVEDISNTIVIGGIGPITGNYSLHGYAIKQGIMLAIDEINNNGGIVIGEETYKLVCEFANDESNIDVAEYAYSSLIDKNASCIIGTYDDEMCKKISEISNKDDMLFINTCATGKKVTDNKNTFSICMLDERLGRETAIYIYNTLKKYKTAVICSEADSKSKNIITAFIEEYEKLGGYVVAKQVIEGEDASGAIDVINYSGAEILFAPINQNTSVSICNTMKELKSEYDVIGTKNWYGISQQINDNSYTDNIKFVAEYINEDEVEKSTKFETNYVKKYVSKPDECSANAYDAVYAYKKAAEISDSLKLDDIKKAMMNINFNGITGDNIEFDSNRVALKNIKVYNIEKGNYIYQQY